MICDKCGYEHNSRSVCPKCGARVVYVNEDYQRRRKEWEKAQKKGKNDGALPPGITHSTREDYDRRMGRDTVVSHERMTGTDGESRQEDAGFSFDVFKAKIKAAKDKFAAFLRKHKKRRGADNPVIRELKFDEDSQDDLDTSKLVLSHKIFKDHRKPVIAVLAAAIILGVGIPAAVYAIRHIDRSRLFIYDGQHGYYADAGNDCMLGGFGRLVILPGKGSSFAGYDDSTVYVCCGGNIRTVKAESPRIIACNESMSLVIYESLGVTRILSGENNIELDFDKKGGYTDACAVSDSGRYFVLTVCSDRGDFTTGEYTVYFGDSTGFLCEVAHDTNDKEIIKLCDDGRLIFSDMTTGDYGIINRRTVSVWDSESRSVSDIADDIYGYGFYADGGELYYLTSSGGIYVWKISEKNQVMLDDEAASICTNTFFSESGGVVYAKDDGYYSCKSGEKPLYLAGAEISASEFYFAPSRKYFYYRDGETLYYVNLKDERRAPAAVCALKNRDGILGSSSDGLLALSADGALWRLGASYGKIQDGVTSVKILENGGGYAYCAQNRLMFVYGGKKPVVLAEDTGSVRKIIFSRKKLYYLSGEGILYRVSPNGSGRENLGYAENIFLFG